MTVHPTKTEIKFQDERFVYQVLKTAVKRALGKYNVTPTLDFERETSFDDIIIDKDKPVMPPSIQVNPNYNPFQSGARSGSISSASLTGRSNPKNWEALFPGQQDDQAEKQGQAEPNSITQAWSDSTQNTSTKKILQLQRKYILAPVKSGLMLIDQQRAHERILFEGYLQQLERQQVNSQQLLFPETVVLADQDAETLKEMLPVLMKLGFEIHEVNKRTFVINAIPTDHADKDQLQETMEMLVEQYALNRIELQKDAKTNAARSLAKRMSIKHGKVLSEVEMIALTEALFACQVPYHSPAGKTVVSILSMDELSEKFK